jgi:UDP-N-acetylmuramate--alanine ligase
LLDDFGTAFHQADDVYFLDIYAASENRIEGVSGEALADKVRSYGHRSVHYVRGMAEGIEAISAAAQPGDLIITLGAGNVSQAGEKILEKLKESVDGTAA